MKSILFVLLGLTLSLPIFAQEVTPDKKSSNDAEIKTIFGHSKHAGKTDIGYFFELRGGYTQFDGRDVFLPGVSGGLILNHHWGLGLTGTIVPGYNLHYDNMYYDENLMQLAGARMMGGYGGFLFEYILLPKSAVHVSFPVTVGAGYLVYQKDSYSSYYYQYDNSNHNLADHDIFFVVEPGIRAVFNLIKKLQLGLTVSYRYTPNLDLINTPASRINQFTATLSLRFGKF